MYPIRESFALGISPHLLFPEAEKSPLHHLAAVAKACALADYETLEMFLPADPLIRQTELSILRDAGKLLNYNSPVDFQLDGPFNAGSADPKIRAAALDLVYRNIDYAAEAESHLMIVTACPDQGEALRPAVLERFRAFFIKLTDYAKARGITIAIEPIERGVFKNLLLGSTAETIAFVKSVQTLGHDNVKAMLDTSHLPLMGEEFAPALAVSLEAGLGHMHLGNSVLNPLSPYYGHKHPPIGIQDGAYDTAETSNFFYELLKCGYLSVQQPGQKPLISLEMTPYPGVSSETSARVAYEKICCAFGAAAARFSAE